jgi:hypothetical protein
MGIREGDVEERRTKPTHERQTKAYFWTNKNVLPSQTQAILLVEMFLVYGSDEQLVVKGYAGASFDTDPDDSKSQTEYVYILNGGAVSWRSCKQSVIINSTTEAEYMAALEASSEGV